MTLKLVVTIVKYLLGSLLLVGFHIAILYSIKHLNKSAYCIFMSMNQIMMYIIQLLQAFWLLQFVSPLKKKPSLLFGNLCPCPQVVPADADGDIAAYAIDPASSALRLTV